MSRLAAETSFFQRSGKWIYIFNFYAWMFWLFGAKNLGRGTRPPASPQAKALLWPLNRGDRAKEVLFTLATGSLNIHRVAWSTYFLHGKTGSSGWKMEMVRVIFWKALENIDCDLRRCNFSILFSLLCWYGYNLPRIALLSRQILLSYVCTQDLTWWFV